MQKSTRFSSVLAMLGPLLPVMTAEYRQASLYSKFLIRMHRFNYLWIDVLAILFVLQVGVSKPAFYVFLVNWFLTLIGIHLIYHRYFAHHSFETSRIFQFILGCIGAMGCQSGPIWWASLHRSHHRHSDQAGDPHSPVLNSFQYSHMGWLLNTQALRIDFNNVKDLSRFPELQLLEMHQFIPPIINLIIILWVAKSMGSALPTYINLEEQVLVWGFFMAIFASRQCTFAINSIGHRFGTRDHATQDNSRNNFILALFTIGSGWHNNHHAFPRSARHGFLWWQVDVAFYLLRFLERVGLVWNLHPAPNTSAKKLFWADGIEME